MVDVYDVCLVAACNDKKVLRTSLLSSPDLSSGFDISLQHDCISAAQAYNRGIASTRAEIMVFLHQDVYLPTQWMMRLMDIIQGIEKHDPKWGVLGVCGRTAGGQTCAWVYSCGLKRMVGKPFFEPVIVRTLDEVILIIRRSSGLRFDEKIGEFHLYGTDICLQAEKRGLRNYAIPCFAIHNSNGLTHLPWSYWRAYQRLRQKWKERLPVVTPCSTIEPSIYKVGTTIGVNYLRRLILRRSPGIRVADPSLLYRELTMQ